MKTGPKVLGVRRSFASALTADAERKKIFSKARNWTPSQINIFGHSIIVDIPTGNLIVSTSDIEYPYYGFNFGVGRSYDGQENYMQLLSIREYPNVNPRPHWFGNWSFSNEVDIEEIWKNTTAEIHATSGVGMNGIFGVAIPTFNRNFKQGDDIESKLRSFGVPGRTLSKSDWKFTQNDFLLRTKRGDFQIATGHLFEETLVDDIEGNVWIFNPISGNAFKITSDYSYRVQDKKYLELGHSLIVSKLTDAMGHCIELFPRNDEAPYNEFVLADESGREIQISLDASLSFPDGNNPGGEVKKRLVNKVVDGSKEEYQEHNYGYEDDFFLSRVDLPSSIGQRRINYSYDNEIFPGILSQIDIGNSRAIRFEYIEDRSDGDDRLNPRLKIKKIEDPQGITYEYQYNHRDSEVFVHISQNGTFDRTVKYSYLRDLNDTKKRYLTSVEVEVKRGYVVNAAGVFSARDPQRPQIIKNATKYSNDGRFNVEAEIDPLGRSIRYQYNDFNMIKMSWDFSDRFTRYTYDIVNSPSPNDPIRYDLIRVERENLIRNLDPAVPGGFSESVETIHQNYVYDIYDVDNSSDNNDYGVQSTHRVSKEIDERGNTRTYFYNDPQNHRPLAATSEETSLGVRLRRRFNNRGEVTAVSDSNNNTYTYDHNDQGGLVEYTDPNGGAAILTYYPCNDRLKTFTDQKDDVTTFQRSAHGELDRIVDPISDEVEYRYYFNGRLKKIINHRPAKIQNPASPRDTTSEYLNLETIINYTALGQVKSQINQNGLEMRINYDESGRKIDWYHDVGEKKSTIYLYDNAGQLERIIDRSKKSTVFDYYDSGFIKSIRYPSWNDGVSDVDGKLVKFKKYDFMGRILRIKDSEISGTTELIYDEAGNLIWRKDPDDFSLTIKIDDNNRLENVTDSTGNFELAIVPDLLDRPQTVTDSSYLDGSLTWNYYYSKQVPGGQPKVLNLFKIELSTLQLATQFDYYENNLLKTVESGWIGGAPIYEQSIYYREDNLVETITGHDSNSFVYDGLKQLIFEHAEEQSLDYDKAGNRLYRYNRSRGPIPVNQYSPKNRLEVERNIDKSFTYDSNGNLKKIENVPNDPGTEIEYFYDGSNRLRLVKGLASNVRYLYDYEGKLHTRMLEDPNTNNLIQEDKFTYLLSKPIIIHRNDNPHLLLTWSPNGKLLRVRWHQAVGGASYANSLFPIYDGVGNIVRFVDSDNNEPIQISFDPHGDILTINDPSDIYEYFGYKGGIFDKDTKNILFGARWYSTNNISRWLSEDPITNFSSERHSSIANLYKYAANNPISFIDRTGLQEESGDLAERLGSQQASFSFLKDPYPSRRNDMIFYYNELMEVDPYSYKGDLYPDVLSYSPMRSNLSLAARYTKHSDVYNLTRWALQVNTLANEIMYGDTSYWAATSASFVKLQHDFAFSFNNKDAIGTWAWAALQELDFSYLSDPIGGTLINLSIRAFNSPE